MCNKRDVSFLIDESELFFVDVSCLWNQSSADSKYCGMLICCPARQRDFMSMGILYIWYALIKMVPFVKEVRILVAAYPRVRYDSELIPFDVFHWWTCFIHTWLPVSLSEVFPALCASLASHFSMISGSLKKALTERKSSQTFLPSSSHCKGLITNFKFSEHSTLFSDISSSLHQSLQSYSVRKSNTDSLVRARSCFSCNGVSRTRRHSKCICSWSFLRLFFLWSFSLFYIGISRSGFRKTQLVNKCFTNIVCSWIPELSLCDRRIQKIAGEHGNLLYQSRKGLSALFHANRCIVGQRSTEARACFRWMLMLWIAQGAN